MTDMQTAPAVKPKRETWLDWVDQVPRAEAMLRAQPLLTTDQLLASLKSQSVEATRSDLSYWQAQGVIPYPIKERRERAVWALYPHWIAQVIGLIREMQKRGRSLDQIAVMLRSNVSNVFGRQLEGDARADLGERIANMDYRAALEKTIPFLQEAAAAFERMTGKPVHGFNITTRTQPREDGWPPDGDSLTVDIHRSDKPDEYWRLRDTD